MLDDPRSESLVSNFAGQWLYLREAAKVEPLPGEIGNQRFRARIVEHAAHLTLQHCRILQLALFSQVQQQRVRDTAPEEEREPRRQFEIIDAVKAGAPGRIVLDPEQEIRGDDQRPQRLFDTVFEGSLLAHAA